MFEAWPEPWPSCPQSPAPQHFTSPLSRRAHVCARPTDMRSTFRPTPRLISGRWSPISPGPSPRVAVEPWPSWPESPEPQHFICPLLRSAQVCPSLLAMAVAVMPEPRSTRGKVSPISRGLRPRAVVEPWPNWPTEPPPQHLTTPFWRRAHVCSSPTATLVALRRQSPRLMGGNASPNSPVPSPRSSVVPWPSWPELPLPQHLTSPLSVKAHVCSWPANTPLALTSSRVVVDVVVVEVLVVLVYVVVLMVEVVVEVTVVVVRTI
mmetsp:Transcript_78782/g.241063  ORF Transcript_78782/g.241063 Transcript_78782/m.241063 type:complete len:264 (+) Transcript_78782:3911-4702(+)